MGSQRPDYRANCAFQPLWEEQCARIRPRERQPSHTFQNTGRSHINRGAIDQLNGDSSYRHSKGERLVMKRLSLALVFMVLLLSGCGHAANEAIAKQVTHVGVYALTKLRAV